MLSSVLNFQKSRGFSLIEIMIATSLVGALSLLVYKITADQQKNIKKNEVKIDSDSIIHEIRQTLANRDSCTATLAGQSASATAVGSITTIKQNVPQTATFVDKYTSNTTFASATRYGSSGVRIISYSLNSTDASDTTIGMIASQPYGSTNLLVTFQYSVNVTPVVRKIKINVQTVSDTNRNILNCTSGGDIADYDARYVDSAGDTMTGNLIIAGNSNIEIQGTGTIIMSSDERLKSEIVTLKDSTSKINQLRPVHFKWKENNKEAAGLIAQELEKIFPHLVQKSNLNNTLTVDYIQLTPYLINAIQELSNENQKIKNELCKSKHQSEFCKKK